MPDLAQGVVVLGHMPHNNSIQSLLPQLHCSSLPLQLLGALSAAAVGTTTIAAATAAASLRLLLLLECCCGELLQVCGQEIRQCSQLAQEGTRLGQTLQRQAQQRMRFYMSQQCNVGVAQPGVCLVQEWTLARPRGSSSSSSRGRQLQYSSQQCAVVLAQPGMRLVN